MGTSSLSGSAIVVLGCCSSLTGTSGWSLGISGGSGYSMGGTGLGVALGTAPFMLGRRVVSRVVGACPAGSAQALYGFSLLSC